MPLPDDISRIKSFYKSAQEQISSEMAQTKYRSRLEQDPKLKNFLRKLQKRGGQNSLTMSMDTHNNSIDKANMNATQVSFGGVSVMNDQKEQGSRMSGVDGDETFSDEAYEGRRIMSQESPDKGSFENGGSIQVDFNTSKEFKRKAMSPREPKSRLSELGLLPLEGHKLPTIDENIEKTGRSTRQPESHRKSSLPGFAKQS